VTGVFLQPRVRAGRRDSEDVTAGTGKLPRNPKRRGESERCGFAACVITKGLLSKVVKPPGLNVSFELAVPCRPVVFEEPSTKLRKLRWGERLDFLLDLLDLVHDLSTGTPV